MLKRTGWLIAFLSVVGVFGLAATMGTGSALPIAQSSQRLGALPENLLLLAKTKCPYDFCYGCERQKVCVVWKHNDKCTDHDLGFLMLQVLGLEEAMLVQSELLSERRLHLQGP